MKKVIFLDRDGVINVDTAYLHRLEDFHWVDGFMEGLQLASRYGFEFIVVTNQSGIARGYFTVADMERIHNHIQSELAKKNLSILQFYYCPHLPDAAVPEYACVCNCRKPKPGMILQAMKDYDINKEESFLVGDSKRDLEAAEGAGIRGYLFAEENFADFIQKILTGENIDEGL